MLYNLECYDEAFVAYEQALQCEARCATAYYGKGGIFLKRGLRASLYSFFKECQMRLDGVAVQAHLTFFLLTFSFTALSVVSWEWLPCTWVKAVLAAERYLVAEQ